jgi:hypothetical protein
MWKKGTAAFPVEYFFRNSDVMHIITMRDKNIFAIKMLNNMYPNDKIHFDNLEKAKTYCEGYCGKKYAFRSQ